MSAVFQMSDFHRVIARAKECQRVAQLPVEHKWYRTKDTWRRLTKEAFWLIEHRNRCKDNTYGAQKADDKLCELFGGILDLSASVCKCELIA